MRVHYLDAAGSTQDVIHQLAADGAPAGTAVMAAEQHAGRGSRGRAWHSPRGGLWLSVLLRPAAAVDLEILSLRSGLAVAEVLAAIPGLPPVTLKWPNDLLLDGRKVGGMLGEARWQGSTLAWVAIGVGLNVANDVPADARWIAARLADFDAELTPRALAEPIVRAVAATAGRGPVLEPAELAAFAARDWLRDRELIEPVMGRGAGIDEDGTLIVRTPGGHEKRVRSGPVVVRDGSG